MGMNLGSGPSAEPEVMMDINTTPLIDVMLVLLIMLIITIPIQLHSVDLNLPAPSKATKKLDPVIVSLEVDADRQVRWNGEVLAGGRPELEARLQAASLQQPQPELHIRSHAKAPYEVVVGVMTSAQRAGLKKLGIVGSEQFAN
ncbi:biopolymer transporter ExbD [Piscinibacter sp. Jin2]|uniref:Biopolymer transporter ExbD n=1 Tax=Aquariibacter lacus TaxID=2801332 RepID=A0A9X1BSQ5_9BURK|nr:biopolymer transporter ExbD [Piscinibacter lacus]MBL0720873.1 biopolymer transporter ExbD [Piscinibacter lacus]